jgi:hypothetical protein
MHISRTKIIDIIKVLSATIILTVVILWWLQKTGEQKSDSFFVDYLNSGDITPAINEETWIHGAAPSVDINQFCQIKWVLCQKVNFIGDFNSQEKVKYLGNEDTITTFISTKNAQKREFLWSLSGIVINENEGKRWYATHNNVVINIGNILSNDEFNQISTHELGHIVDLWFLQWNDPIKDTNYTEFNKAVFAKNDPSLYYYALSRDSETIRKANAKKQDFCSTYGMTDPFEDFAECFNLYVNHNKLFKFLWQQDITLWRKYNFLASLFKGNYLISDTANIKLFKNKVNERVWDTTKLSIK